ncbi:hypothetical protein [Pseudomonas sp. RIT-PI-AD]|uniref:hypothetical protein n=1 Tax=Pseudomonas sp. RIT-PI-AD TaxID=3035294 RepID=UPI0021DA197A|nr:hypothetical protein [Pseudomonas sp. RIT-PI-AD]
MSYLKLNRYIGEALVLTVRPSTDPQAALAALMEEGIRVFVRDARSNRTQLGIVLEGGIRGSTPG